MIVQDEQKLRQLSVEINKSDRQLMTFLQQKLENEAEHSGEAVGLAAPQIGSQKRAFIIRNPKWDEPPVYELGLMVYVPKWLFYVNPRILERDGEQESVEGCLSLPGIQVKITRALQILVEDDFEGRKYTLTEFDAAVFQHELDHLDGILMTDRGTIVVPPNQPLNERLH